MATFTRSQKLQQASIAERIANFRVEQKAESERQQQELKEKQAKEWVEFEEKLQKELQEVELKKEEERRKETERKQREAMLRGEEEMQRKRRSRPLEEKQDLPREHSGNLKRKRPPILSEDSDLSEEHSDDDAGQEGTDREPAPNSKVKVDGTALPRWTRGMVGGERRCQGCIEADVRCDPPEGKRSLRCKRCVKHRRKCVPNLQKENGQTQTAIVAETDDIGEIRDAFDRSGGELVSALRETTASLKELVAELKTCCGSLVMKREIVVGLTAQKVETGESNFIGAM